MSLSHISISGKMRHVVAMTATATLGAALFAYIGWREISNDVTRIDQSGAASILGGQVSQNLLAMYRAEYLFATSEEDTEEAAEMLSSNARLFEVRIAALDSKLNDGKGNMIVKVREAYKAYLNGTAATIATARKCKDRKSYARCAEIMESLYQSRERADLLNSAVKQLIDSIEPESDVVNREANRIATFLSIVMVASSLLGIGVGVGIGILISRYRRIITFLRSAIEGGWDYLFLRKGPLVWKSVRKKNNNLKAIHVEAGGE